jgi:DNA modification methylase
MKPDTYREFLEQKIRLATKDGFDVAPAAINPQLKLHVQSAVRWALRGGRRAIFAAFGLHKTSMQIEMMRLAGRHLGGPTLVVLPLGVKQEFPRDAGLYFNGEYAVRLKFIRSAAEMEVAQGEHGYTIHLTNYETVRDGKLDPKLFVAASLDEASVLRGFGGSKTFREFMRLFDGLKFKFVATATPSPNDYIELLAYAAFLEVMDVGEAKTRFFKRNSEKADKLVLHPHKEREFWLWVASWALFIEKPSDLGFSDDGYVLPDIDVRWHEIPSDHSTAGYEKSGQGLLMRNAAIGVQSAAREKRESLDARLDKLMALRTEDPGAHRIIWHDLEDERRAIEQAIPSVVSVYGAQNIEDKEKAIIEFSDGIFAELATKPRIAGSGCNFQRHCWWEIFLGIGFKFNDMIQAIHRVQRFGQPHACRVDLIYTEAERPIRLSIEEKWKRHNDQRKIMTEIVKKYGLSEAAMADTLARSFGVERIEVAAEKYRLVNNDCVEETRRMEADSVDLIVTSIPFSTQYEYTPSFNDFGHTDDDGHFWRQMDFLTPELLRVLQPGRIAAVHVKDRITPGGINGLGFQTVSPFSDDCVAHFRRHGFAFLARKTIVTDVVRENNQTYRLGWTEQCKDGSRMGAGLPEYLLLFRKPPTDRSNGYADVPVVKDKKEWKSDHWVNEGGYSRARWQIDAHGFSRSDGNRLLKAEELTGLPADEVYKVFRAFSHASVYDFEHHIMIGEALEAHGSLPPTFMLLPPQSWHPDVWTDVTRMLTLNGAQHAKGKEMHLCLARGSLVLTLDGYRPIEEVKSGDFVLTHKGRWRRVTVVRKTGTKPVVGLHAQGVAALLLTPDHKLWTRKVRDIPSAQNHSRQDAMKRDPVWVRADETVGSYINQKLPPVQPSSLTETECWLIGRWIADGHVGTRGDYWVSIGPEKLDEFERMSGRHAGTRHRGTAIQIRLKGLSKAVRTVLGRCGRGAANKNLPGELLSLPTAQASSLLAGYLSGDGHYNRTRMRWSASSVSRALLLGISLLAQRVYGAVASVYAGRSEGATMIEGRHVVTKQEWVLSFDIPSAKRSKGLPFIAADGAWKKVRSADAVGDVETWCLRVEEDESFTAEGCIVKNCPLQFDIVDRAIAQYTMPGETVFDPFGGLMTVPFRAVKMGRKGIGIELNPGYFLDGVAYVEAAAREMGTPSLFDLVEVA